MIMMMMGEKTIFGLNTQSKCTLTDNAHASVNGTCFLDATYIV
jgi:hypothetical protein